MKSTNKDNSSFCPPWYGKMSTSQGRWCFAAGD